MTGRPAKVFIFLPGMRLLPARAGIRATMFIRLSLTEFVGFYRLFAAIALSTALMTIRICSSVMDANMGSESICS